MGVANLQCGLDRLHADILPQGHGAKINLGNTGAMGFYKLHHNLLERRKEWGLAGGQLAAECPLACTLPTQPSSARPYAACDHPEGLHWNNSRVKIRTCINRV